MARKPNYSFEKRKKEMDRKAKKDARREDRLLRKRGATPAEPGPSTPESHSIASAQSEG